MQAIQREPYCLSIEYSHYLTISMHRGSKVSHQNKLELPYATTIAKQIKAEILAETGLIASTGVSFNTFLAKMASGMNKPNGLTAILPEHAADFVATLPIEKFHGIGQVTASKMHNLGIHTGADLKRYSEADLVRYFGKVGRFYYLIARGEDKRSVEPNRERKSIGAENSFTKDLDDPQVMLLELDNIAQTVQHRARKLSSSRTHYHLVESQICRLPNFHAQ